MEYYCWPQKTVKNNTVYATSKIIRKKKQLITKKIKGRFYLDRPISLQQHACNTQRRPSEIWTARIILMKMSPPKWPWPESHKHKISHLIISTKKKGNQRRFSAMAFSAITTHCPSLLRPPTNLPVTFSPPNSISFRFSKNNLSRRKPLSIRSTSTSGILFSCCSPILFFIF